MNRIIIFTLMISFLSGCELVVIGSKTPIKKRIVVNYNQKTPLGSILLFKTELDSNNSYAASDLIASADGLQLIALERYNRSFDIERMRRQISMMPLTDLKTDTLGNNIIRYTVEYDLIKSVTYHAKQIDSSWYIIKYQVDK